MSPIENTCRLLGSLLATRWEKVSNRRNGTGFSIWHDFENTVHVDFFGMEDSLVIDELRALAVGLHAGIETEANLQVDFFTHESEANGTMIRHFES